MAATAAERQAARRQRVSDEMARLRSEVVSLRRRAERAEVGLEAAMDDVARLEAAASAGPIARCERCRTELACPRCYAGNDYA